MIKGKAFPLGDTPYVSEDLRKWFYVRTSGVISTDNNLRVIANDNMTVSVTAGVAYINDGGGGLALWTEVKNTLTAPVADNYLNRIDTVVLRWDKSSNTTGLEYVVGNLADKPIVKPPVRDANTYELVLAQVYVGKGTGKITAKDITDTRLDEKICGVVRDNITGIPTQALNDQFKDWVESLKGILDKDAAGHLQVQIEDIFNGGMFKIAQNESTITLGSYKEWVAAGKPKI